MSLDQIVRLHQAADAAQAKVGELRGKAWAPYLAAKMDYDAAALALNRATIDLVVAAHGWSINRTETTWLALVAA